MRARLRRERLAALKDRIRASGLPVREGYPDPQALGRLVLEDLTGVIERLFPAGSELSPIERERRLHQEFARSRAGVYIGRAEYFERLDVHVESDGSPLVVIGESGSGKSALLANWEFRLAERREQALFAGDSAGAAFVIGHFVGASRASADWMAMLRRIISELNEYFTLAVDTPHDASLLRAAFANTLHLAAARGPVVLIIDALNQLQDRDGAPDLVWLPPMIPSNVRLVVSALPGRALNELHRRRWATLEITPLDHRERERLTHAYLGGYGKVLPDFLVSEIAGASQAENPLFLRATLDELRLYGQHETLRHRLCELLSAPDIPHLYELMLTRWERDYDRDRPALVRDAMSLLWAARFGLSESELLDLLGGYGGPMPHAHWSPLYLAAKQMLVNRDGLLGFAHEYGRAAVAHRYMPTEPDQRLAHMRLADYFDGQPVLAERRVAELPWQLDQARAWDALATFLGDLRTLVALNRDEQRHFEWRGYWARVEANSQLRLVDTYRPLIDDAQLPPSVSLLLADGLKETGYLSEALALYNRLVRSSEVRGDDDGVVRAVKGAADIHVERGELDQALLLNELVEREGRESGNLEAVAVAVGSQAMIAQTQGYVDRALTLHQKAEAIARQGGYEHLLTSALFGRIRILTMQGNLAEAMAIAEQVERRYREKGDQDGLAACLGNQAVIRAREGALDRALALHKEVEQLSRRLGSWQNLAMSLCNQGKLLARQGELLQATDVYQEQESICRRIGYAEGLALSLEGQAIVCRDGGDHDRALTLFRELEVVSRRRGIADHLIVALVNQGAILRYRDEPEAALAKFDEVERICRSLGHEDWVQAMRQEKAKILNERDDAPPPAGGTDHETGSTSAGNRRPGYGVPDSDEKERIARSPSSPPAPPIVSSTRQTAGQPSSSEDQMDSGYDDAAALRQVVQDARAYRARGDLENALAELEKQESLARRIGHEAALADALGSQARLLETRGDDKPTISRDDDLREALARYKEMEHICRQRADRDGLFFSLAGQASVLAKRGDPDVGLTLLAEIERSCRETEDMDGLQIVLGYQASMRKAQGNLDAAIAALGEQIRICDEIGDRDALQSAFGALGDLFLIPRRSRGCTRHRDAGVQATGGDLPPARA